METAVATDMETGGLLGCIRFRLYCLKGSLKNHIWCSLIMLTFSVRYRILHNYNHSEITASGL